MATEADIKFWNDTFGTDYATAQAFGSGPANIDQDVLLLRSLERSMEGLSDEQKARLGDDPDRRLRNYLYELKGKLVRDVRATERGAGLHRDRADHVANQALKQLAKIWATPGGREKLRLKPGDNWVNKVTDMSGEEVMIRELVPGFGPDDVESVMVGAADLPEVTYEGDDSGLPYGAQPLGTDPFDVLDERSSSLRAQGRFEDARAGTLLRGAEARTGLPPELADMPRRMGYAELGETTFDPEPGRRRAAEAVQTVSEDALENFPAFSAASPADMAAGVGPRNAFGEPIIKPLTLMPEGKTIEGSLTSLLDPRVTATETEAVVTPSGAEEVTESVSAPAAPVPGAAPAQPEGAGMSPMSLGGALIGGAGIAAAIGNTIADFRTTAALEDQLASSAAGDTIARREGALAGSQAQRNIMATSLGRRDISPALALRNAQMAGSRTLSDVYGQAAIASARERRESEAQLAQLRKQRWNTLFGGLTRTAGDVGALLATQGAAEETAKMNKRLTDLEAANLNQVGLAPGQRRR